MSTLALLAALSVAAPQGKDFIAEVRALSRVLTCAPAEEPLPAGLDAQAIELHCVFLGYGFERYREHHLAGARHFLAPLRPEDPGGPVAYPFAGVDLAGALTVFPGAEQLDTFSDAWAGDPRRVLAPLPKKQLEAELGLLRASALATADTGGRARLDKLAALQLPGPLSCFLIALALHGATPIAARYFVVEGGLPRYLDAPERPEDFANLELQYSLDGKIHTLRHHGSAALAEPVLAATRHAAALVRGAPYPLWQPSAARLRELLLRADWVLSDSSGPTPSEAERAGLAVELFGRFAGAPTSGVDLSRVAELVRRFAEHPERLMPFRFGLSDAARAYHLQVARRDRAWRASELPLIPAQLIPTSSTSTSAAPPEWLTWSSTSAPDVAPVVLGGKHARLLTAEGPVHVWRPPNYRHETAGVVIYLHGYFTTVDRAWIDHRLAAQFLASRRNALFIVPEAAAGDEELPPYAELDALLGTVAREAKLEIPRGPLVVAAHSGGYRGIVAWLAHTRLGELVLLDALYGQIDRFRAWLDAPGHRAIVIGAETDERSKLLTRKRRDALRLEALPESLAELAKKAKHMAVVAIRAELDHMALVTEGRALPMALELTAVPPVPKETPKRAPRRSAPR